MALRSIPKSGDARAANAAGEWVNDRTHGQQFRAKFLKTSPPTSVVGIERYLASGMIRGIGPVYAKKLVRAFGETVFDVIEAEPDRLREVDGIGPVRAGWATIDYTEFQRFLAPYFRQVADWSRMRRRPWLALKTIKENQRRNLECHGTKISLTGEAESPGVGPPAMTYILPSTVAAPSP